VTPVEDLRSCRLDFEEPTMAQNEDNRPLRDFTVPRANGIHLGYTVPVVEANNFELKPALLNIFSQHVFHG
jgi:hypothetical protein